MPPIDPITSAWNWSDLRREWPEYLVGGVLLGLLLIAPFWY